MPQKTGTLEAIHAKEGSMLRVRLFLLLPIFTLLTTTCLALDVVKTFDESDTDQRNAYPLALLSLALDKTTDDYGPYQLEMTFQLTSRDRGLLELQTGELVNVLSVPTRPEWEKRALCIPISLHKDLLDYRVLLIDSKKAELFSGIRSYEQLKLLRFGLMEQWTTTKILQAQSFNVVTSTYYEGLFDMLMHDRFDVFLRGLSEVASELSIQGANYPNLMIEPTLAVHLPMPVYFFVSPKTPRLKERIETGLMRMQADGSFDELFELHHGGNVKSLLKNKRIIEIPNPYMAPPGQPR